MMLAAGGYSRPRAARGAVAQPARNARHEATAMSRSPAEVLNCDDILDSDSRCPTCILDQRPIETSNFILFKFYRFNRKSELLLDQMRTPDSIWCRGLFGLALTTLLGSCAAYGPYHANMTSDPLNSVRGPAGGRYKFAFIEFGDQGSALDTSQRAAAINVIRQAQRPLLFVYIHGWMNNAVSGDVCRFEHFIDMVSRLPEVTHGKINVVGVYIAWRGKDLTLPGLDLLTFWNRKLTGGAVAAQNSCLATINELVLARREPGKKGH